MVAQCPEECKSFLKTGAYQIINFHLQTVKKQQFPNLCLWYLSITFHLFANLSRILRNSTRMFLDFSKLGGHLHSILKELGKIFGSIQSFTQHYCLNIIFHISSDGSKMLLMSSLFGYDVGIHLLQCRSWDDLPKKTKIDPRDNQIAFQVYLKSYSHL